ncbi:fimbria/pilus periplasmic chaperone [Qipengyuania sp. JC766]|uniref:fimbria/pilus periplasmic chaperone n=1 Tax=Qipengyuania sp. JC766 TaxID=3232139 RepID=UPI00345989C5
MILELEPAGRGAVARVELTNDGSKDIPYEVRMMRGEISPQGELSLTPADDQFLVFPAQAIVESNSQQVFRVQYVGEAALARSEIYYMSIREIPVDFEKGTSQVQVVVNYNVLANVVPDGSRPSPVIRSARFISSESAATLDANIEEEADPPAESSFSGVEIDLANEGNRYMLAGMSTWTLTGTTVEGQPFERKFQPEELTKMIGVGVVAPGKNRVFRLPLDTSLTDESIKVQIDI